MTGLPEILALDTELTGRARAGVLQILQSTIYHGMVLDIASPMPKSARTKKLEIYPRGARAWHEKKLENTLEKASELG